MSTIARLPYVARGVALIASASEQRRREFTASLRGNGWASEEALGGADALAKLESGNFRILILDSPLPDLDPDEVRIMAQSRFAALAVITPGAATLSDEESPEALELERQLLSSEAGLRPPKIGPARCMCQFTPPSFNRTGNSRRLGLWTF